MKRATLATIAAKVGVSKPVVYTVLKNRLGKGIGVSAATRQKILKVAHACGYVPNKNSRALFTGRSDTIGVLIHRIIPPFSDLLTHIHREARKLNLDVLPYLTDGDPENEERALQMLRDGRVDGVIALATTLGSGARYQKFSRRPYRLKLLLYGEPVAKGIPSVHFDDPQAGKLAAQHLLEVGCRRLAFLGSYASIARARAFTGFLRKRGLAPAQIIPPILPDIFLDAKECARNLLARKIRPDGVFATNDIYGAALIGEAREQGVRIPADLAVLGCDNMDIAGYAAPQLSSIDTNIPLVAARLVQRLAQMIARNRFETSHERVPVRLIARESTVGKETR